MLGTLGIPQVAIPGLHGEVGKSGRLDATLKSYAQLAAAAAIGCRWYLDFDYFAVQNDGLDIVKVREVPRWRESGVFTDLERDVMEYAGAMSTTPSTVTDWMVEKLIDQLGRPSVTELTEAVAVENMRSRYNSALALQGRADSTLRELPLARSSGAASSCT